MAMDIHLATTEAEIMACFPLMQELRPHLEAADFLDRIRRQERASYRLAYVDTTEGPVALAGFRLGENLAWGNFLYVDDLVTLAGQRSKGYGAALLDWLKKYASDKACSQLHLDSGTQRQAAHCFYEREGMDRSGFHFVWNIL